MKNLENNLYLVSLNPTLPFYDDPCLNLHLPNYFKESFNYRDKIIIIKTALAINQVVNVFKKLTGFESHEIMVVKIKEYQGSLDLKSQSWLNRSSVDKFCEKQPSNVCDKVSEKLDMLIEKVDKKNYFNELENMIGLENVKSFIRRFSKFLKIQKERKEKEESTYDISLNMVFKGPPGTGKTSIARLLGGIYKDFGYLKGGHTVEVDRCGLVAEYVGQTAPKTLNVLKKALDGVLFIDEAYSLNSGAGNDFGREAVETIMKFMEDNKEELLLLRQDTISLCRIF